MLKQDWYYFGCHGEAGHYAWSRGMHRLHGTGLEHFDGILMPQDTSEQFVACVSRLGSLHLTALGFWDLTVDSRPRSCSIIFGPSLIAPPAHFLEGAKAFFPQVYARWPAITIRTVMEPWI